MINEDTEPGDNEEYILAVSKKGRDSGEPWGRANPLYLRECTEINKQQINDARNQLMAAGWVQKITDDRSEFVADPRSE